MTCLKCEDLAQQNGALEADIEELRSALEGMMQMNREIFGNHLFAAFRAGKDDFHKAWVIAETALEGTKEKR